MGHWQQACYGFLKRHLFIIDWIFDPMLSVAVFYPDGVGKIRGGVTVRNSAAMKKAETSTGQLL